MPNNSGRGHCEGGGIIDFLARQTLGRDYTDESCGYNPVVRTMDLAACGAGLPAPVRIQHKLNIILLCGFVVLET
ncbi:MAG: hypothetical protein ACR2QX_01650 [Woeseiaceae bacterium]